jgi:recombination associated protein RdgC
MWFKNLRLYRLLKTFEMTEDELDERLGSQAFRPCGSHDVSSLGWTSPLGRSSQRLVHELGGCIMLCARQEDKLLPSAVINEALEERLETLEAEEARKPSRKERTQLRDDITHQLLPKAFAKSTRTFALIDTQNGWILVDASSANRAESVIMLLRETLGSLPVRPFETVVAPAAVMTEWVAKPATQADFELLDSCELRDSPEVGGVIRCVGEDLTADEIQAHLAAGKQVVKLALQWDERISCVLEADLAIKRIKFLDILQEQLADVETEDEAARFDLSFSLMSLEFRRLIPRILQLCGGLTSVE